MFKSFASVNKSLKITSARRRKKTPDLHCTHFPKNNEVKELWNFEKVPLSFRAPPKYLFLYVKCSWNVNRKLSKDFRKKRGKRFIVLRFWQGIMQKRTGKRGPIFSNYPSSAAKPIYLHISFKKNCRVILNKTGTFERSWESSCVFRNTKAECRRELSTFCFRLCKYYKATVTDKCNIRVQHKLICLSINKMNLFMSR